MTQKASVDRLPPDIREKLDHLIQDPRWTQAEMTDMVNTWLEEQGEYMRMSKSAINRYSQKMDKIGAKLKQSREIAQVWIGKLGTQPQGQVGQLLNEVVRNLAFDTAIQLSEGEEPADPRMIKELAVAIERLEKAASDSEKRADDIRKRQREESAQAAEKVAKKQGVSAEGIEALRAAIMGAMA